MAKPPRAVALVGAATAFSLLGDQTLYSVLPTDYERIGLLPFQVGLLLSVNRWIRLLTNHLAERLIRCYGITRLLTASLLVGAVLTAVYGTVTSFTILLAARMTWGLCWSFIRQSGMLTASESASSSNAGEVMGYYNGISRIGSVAGNLLGAIGSDIVGLARTLFVFAGVSLLGTPLGALSQTKRGTVPPVPSRHTPLGHNVGIWSCGFIEGCVGAGLIMSTLGLALKDRVGDSVLLLGIAVGVATVNGLLLSTRWVLDGLGAPLLGAVSDRLGRRRSAFLFFGTGSVALLSASAVPHAAVLMLAVLVFFVCGTSVSVLVAAEAGRRGSRDIAAYVTAGDLGSASGPLIGWTIRQMGLPVGMIFLVGGALYGAALLAARFAFARTLGGQSEP